MDDKAIEEMTAGEALESYAELMGFLASMLEQKKKLERIIKTHVLETGELLESSRAKCSIRKGYTRSSWNDGALRGYAVAYPEVLEFVKETEVKPTVAIKVKK